MESLSVSNQTLKQFLDAPFGIPNNLKHLKYEERYQSFKRSNKIEVEGCYEEQGNYFIHVKVPSESQNGSSYYDVVIEFFHHDSKNNTELSLENYYVQFFSNSPGFVYKYAALYKLNGYLIESLYDKIGLETLNVLPDKANSTYELYYDSSIYYAARFLLDNKSRNMGKYNIKIFKRKTAHSFFSDIQDVESVNISRSVSSMQSSLTKEIAKDKKLSEQQELKLKKNPFFFNKIKDKREKEKNKSTFKDKSTEIKTVSSKKSTGGLSTVKQAPHSVRKKATHSTVKRK